MNSRKVPLKGAKNARDFRGIRNREGKQIITPLFVRSNELVKINDHDAALLTQEHSIRTVIDLRTVLEREERADRELPGVKNIHVPVFTESTMGITHEGALDRKKLLDSMPDMAELYKRMVTLDECVNELRRAMQLITESEGGVLWHCTAGKDRCGMVSALFLSLLDVDRETILRDYLLTNRVCFADANGSALLVLLIYHSKEKAKKAKGLLSAERRFMEAAFDAMEEQCGSVDAFLRDRLGISEEAKEKLKKKCLEQ